MKILILTDHASYGGVSKASESLQKNLNTDQFKVERYPIYKTHLGFAAKLLAIFRAFLFVLMHDFDKLILTHFEAIFVGLLCRPFKIKKQFIYTVHTDLHAYYNSASYIKKHILRFIFRLLRNEPLVFDSKESELKAKKYFDFANTRAIYNIVPFPFDFVGRRDNVIFRFGSVSRLHSGKNIDLLIRVFDLFWRDNKNTELLIFGEGPELKRLTEYVEIFPSRNAIKFEGYLADSNEIYSRIDSLVGFSSMEGFGLVILEALLRNVPVLYSDCSCGPREILKPDSNPCIKTDTYESGAGGVLVKIPENNNAYSSHLSEPEKKVLEAFVFFYQNFSKMKKMSSMNLRRFGIDVVKGQWTDFLST